MNEIELDYDAISIDTSIFENRGLLLETGLLKQISQFCDSPVVVLMPDVIDKELVKHLSDKVKNTRHKLKSSINDARSHLMLDEDNRQHCDALLKEIDSSETIARKRLNLFYERCGVEILHSEHFVNTSELIVQYFENKPPFETLEIKKVNFPTQLRFLHLSHGPIKTILMFY